MYNFFNCRFDQLSDKYLNPDIDILNSNQDETKIYAV